MRPIDLREHQPSGPWTLSIAERDGLREVLPSVTVEPVRGTEGTYSLSPGSIVGAVEIGELSVSIRPKLDIARVLFLACYAMGAFKLREMDRFAFDTVLFPVNRALWSAGFGPQVVARAADQGVGVLALKSLARGRWPEGVERSRPTWYEPHADPGQIRRAAAFTLSRGAASLLPPGDPELFWPAVDACTAPAEATPPADPAPAAAEDQDAQRPEAGAGDPLFRYPAWS